ncbi:MAG: rhodanese-like domain-containing protein [Propionicimonas sp.]
MSTSVKQMVEAADAVVPRITPADAQQLISGDDALVLDLRDAPEVARDGKVAGALNISRGMLEFRADPASASHEPQLRKDRPVIVYCASGGRSALGGKALKELGFEQVYNLGGFKAWVEAGGEVDQPTG